MSDEKPNWVELQVVHFDSVAPEVSLNAPTPLAPWHAWVAEQYHRCHQPEEFCQRLTDARGPVLVLLHFTDLEDWGAAASEFFADWMQSDPVGPMAARPTRQIMVYSGSWMYGDQSRDVDNLLPAEEHRRRWTTVPSDHLYSWACPMAWLGSIETSLTIDQLSACFDTWRPTACRTIVIPRSGDLPIRFEYQAEEKPFLMWLRRHLRESLLIHDLRYGMNNARLAQNRSHADGQRVVYGRLDALWVLQCVAGDLEWQRSQALSKEILAICGLRLRSGMSLTDENAVAWQEVGQAICRLIDDVCPECE